MVDRGDDIKYPNGVIAQGSEKTELEQGWQSWKM